MPPKSTDIQGCVIHAFDKLPAKCKPRARDGNAREWVPLAGVVLSRPCPTADAPYTLTCVALGTSTGCLPANKVPSAHGVVLHDWHAEILAVRAFNRFLLDECAIVASSGARASSFIRRRAIGEMSQAAPQPFALQSDLRIHMYCSEAPCGDASMELTMAAQDDPTPWVPKYTTPGERAVDAALRGRACFSELGVVRRKPARSDAPPTLSKSCTDKLALKQCTSLLNVAAALVLNPRAAYLRTLILPKSQRDEAATERAFGPSGRMEPLAFVSAESWHGGYSFRPFEIQTVARDFDWSRRSGLPSQRLMACNIGALCTPLHQEVIINGALQGRRQGHVMGASVVSRLAFWRVLADIAERLNHDSVPEVLDLAKSLAGGRRYAALKSSPLLRGRRQTKELATACALRPWVENAADDDFGLS